MKVEKVDSDRFDPNKYNFQCEIEAKGPKSSRGVGGPCTYDALTQGKYSETIDEYKDDAWVKVKKSGVWSAKLAGK